MTAPGLLVIVASPSGGGKDTIIRGAMEQLAAQGVPTHHSVSHTTRAPRPAEAEGRDYYFVDRATFERMVAAGEFLEWAVYAGNLYGTSRREIAGRLEAGLDVFLDIEVQGARQIRSRMPEAVTVFVLPPSFEVLEQRLVARRQDSAEAIRRRLGCAASELEAVDEFGYAIINDRLDEAVEALVAICRAEHHRSQRMQGQARTLRESFALALAKDVSP